MQETITYTAADIAYIEENFVALAVRPPGPGPSYVLPDGREFYPKDYDEHETHEFRFKRRLLLAAQMRGLSHIDSESEWQAYLAGLYGVCLKSATPENIVQKDALLHRIDSLLEDVRNAVDELDLLERDFAPDYDRLRFGRPTTRETYITKLREAFLAYATT